MQDYTRKQCVREDWQKLEQVHRVWRRLNAYQEELISLSNQNVQVGVGQRVNDKHIVKIVTVDWL
jgi:hypothetical protein